MPLLSWTPDDDGLPIQRRRGRINHRHGSSVARLWAGSASNTIRRCRMFLTRTISASFDSHVFFVVFCFARICGWQSKEGAAAGAAAALNVEEALFEGEDEDLDDLDIEEGA